MNAKTNGKICCIFSNKHHLLPWNLTLSFVIVSTECKVKSPDFFSMLNKTVDTTLDKGTPMYSNNDLWNSHNSYIWKQKNYTVHSYHLLNADLPRIACEITLIILRSNAFCILKGRIKYSFVTILSKKVLRYNSARLPQHKILLFKEACSKFSWQSLCVRATCKSEATGKYSP